MLMHHWNSSTNFDQLTFAENVHVLILKTAKNKYNKCNSKLLKIEIPHYRHSDVVKRKENFEADSERKVLYALAGTDNTHIYSNCRHIN